MSFESISFLILGLLALFIGAEGLLKGSSALALKLGITPLVVGLTVVAFGTSAPELVVSFKAALLGNTSITLGNVIGSNIANIALILGTASLIRPLDVHANVIRKEIPTMIAFTILMVFILLDGEVGFVDGLIFVLVLIAHITINIKLARKEKNAEVETEFKEGLKVRLGVPLSIIFVVGGLGLMVLGANFFVTSSISIAKAIGVNDAIIGLTVVAIGTSLPELVTAVVASYKKESDIAVGNVVGSNIFNILGILGITALITPINADELNFVDFGMMILTAILLFPLSKTGFRISRLEGAFLVVGYLVYMFYLLPN